MQAYTYLFTVTPIPFHRSRGMLEGKTLKELQAEIRLPEFKNLPFYEEWLPLNITGVYNTLIDQSYFNFRPDLDTEF